MAKRFAVHWLNGQDKRICHCHYSIISVVGLTPREALAESASDVSVLLFV